MDNFTNNLENKIETETFRLNASFFNDEQYLFLENNKSKDIFKSVHSIKIFPGYNYIEINYLKHKRNNNNNNNNNENFNINEINRFSNQKKNTIDYIKKDREEFYKNSIIYSFTENKTYQNFINKITNFNIFRNNRLNRQSSIGIPITELEYLIEQNSFLQNIDPLCISPNMPKNFSENSLTIFPNSLTAFLFNKIKNTNKNNFNNNNNNILFIGECGMGKTFSIMLIIFLLKLNPFNLIISIFNQEEFSSNPAQYLCLEIIHSLMFLYLNNDNLNINELYYLYYSINENNFDFVLNKIFEIIIKVFNVYNNKLNFFFFVDQIENFNDETLKKIDEIKNKINNLKLSSFGLVNNNIYQKCKIIEILNSDHQNSNKIIYEKFEKFKDFNTNSILNNFIVFLNPQEIFDDSEMFKFIDYNFNFNNNKNLSNSIKSYLIKQTGKNYSLINDLISRKNIENVPRTTIFEILKDNFEENFFHKIHNIKSMTKKEEELTKIIYQIFSYKKISEISEKLTFTFFSENYKHYDYNLVIPITITEKNEINFILKNQIVSHFINSFDYEKYLKLIDIKKLSLNCFTNFYQNSKSNVLKGILLEEILYFLFINNSRLIRFKAKIVIYAKDTKINNNLNKIITENFISFSVPKIEKSLLKKTDIFERDDVFSLNNSTNFNGIYFLSHNFPCIDALIINNKEIFLIQIKKTLIYDHIYTINKDFHYLYLMLENSDVFNELIKQNDSYFKSNTKKFNTKLNFWIKIAKIIKNNFGYNFHFMFVFKEKHFGLDIEKNCKQISIEKEFKEKNEIIEQKIFTKWETKLNVENQYFVDEEKLQINIFCKKMLKNIFMCSLDDFTKEIVTQGNENFFLKLKD